MWDFYRETVTGGGLTIKLVWEELGKPALELPPELTGTGEHVMYSLLVDSKSCYVEVNGRRLEGHPVPHVSRRGYRSQQRFCITRKPGFSPTSNCLVQLLIGTQWRQVLLGLHPNHHRLNHR